MTYHKVLTAAHLGSPNLDLEPRTCAFDDEGVHLQNGGVFIFGLPTARAVGKQQGGMTVL